MVYFKQKPVVVECWQLTDEIMKSKEPWEHVPEWVEDAVPNWSKKKLCIPLHDKNSVTSFQWQWLYPNDWLVREVDGSIRVVRDIVFQNVFEAV